MPLLWTQVTVVAVDNTFSSCLRICAEGGGGGGYKRDAGGKRSNGGWIYKPITVCCLFRLKGMWNFKKDVSLSSQQTKTKQNPGGTSSNCASLSIHPCTFKVKRIQSSCSFLLTASTPSVSEQNTE